MALSKLEAELNKATGIKFEGGKRQTYLGKMQKFCADDEKGMSADKWDELSSEAQKWANAATRAFNAKKDIEDFAEADEPRQERRTRDRDDDKDDKGKDDNKGGKGRSGGKDKDEDAPRSGRRSREDDEKEKPAPRGGRSGGKDKDEEKPARAARGKDDSKGEGKALEGVKVDIKRMLIKDTEIGAADIHKKLGKTSKMSITTVGNLRAEFRHSLKVLKQEGHLKGIEI